MTSSSESRRPKARPGRSSARAVVLIGFMGSGKTCVGHALSRALGWTFQDLDSHVEARQRRSIADIFRDFGEAEFRRAECEALSTLLKELSPTSPAVIALGGGAFVQPAIRQMLAQEEIAVVWLDAPPEELWQRCVQQQLERPLAADRNQFQQLYEERRKHYTEAGIHVDTRGKDIDQVAEEVIRHLSVGPSFKEK
jgi:shikimate kinase